MYGDIEWERERFMEKTLGEAVLVTAQERRGGRVRARGRAQAAGFSRGGRAEPCRGGNGKPFTGGDRQKAGNP